MPLQRYHATETIPHLLGGQQVVWMAGKSRVVHLPDGRVAPPVISEWPLDGTLDTEG